jgi:hypothetical protein
VRQKTCQECSELFAYKRTRERFCDRACSNKYSWRSRDRDNLNLGRKSTHGMTGTPTYGSWRAMLKRCGNSSDPAFPRYGGAGICVCPRWFSFQSFFEDMGERPEGTTLDRIDGSKGYERYNCRWATAKEQAENRRSTRQVTLGQVTLCLADWARRTGIPEDTLRVRIDRLGWSVEEALSRPLAKQAVDGRPATKYVPQKAFNDATNRVQWRPE